MDRPTLVALGLSHDYGARQVDTGRWQRVHRGVYCSYTGPLTLLSRCEAALRAVGHDAILDGAAALQVNKVPGYAVGKGPIEVVVSHGVVRRKVAGVRIRQTTALTERSWWTRENMPVLRPEWAVVAVARRMPARARGAITSAVQTGHVLAAQVFAVLLATGSFRGRPRLMTITRDIGGSRSELEALFIELCKRAGVSLPEQNYPLTLEGRRAWLDACWPALGLAVEIDGKAYHVLSEDWESDLTRQNDIVLAGWRVLRFSAAALRDQPETVIATLRTALGLRPARVAG